MHAVAVNHLAQHIRPVSRESSTRVRYQLGLGYARSAVATVAMQCSHAYLCVCVNMYDCANVGCLSVSVCPVTLVFTCLR